MEKVLKTDETVTIEGTVPFDASRIPLPPTLAAIRLLQSWIDEGDAEEQRETGEYLMQALDEDRLSDRKLFP